MLNQEVGATYKTTNLPGIYALPFQDWLQKSLRPSKELWLKHGIAGAFRQPDTCQEWRGGRLPKTAMGGGPLLQNLTDHAVFSCPYTTIVEQVYVPSCDVEALLSHGHALCGLHSVLRVASIRGLTGGISATPALSTVAGKTRPTNTARQRPARIMILASRP